MNLIILSRNRQLYSTRRLLEAGQARGHHVEVLDALQCYMDIASSAPTVYHRGRRVRADAVIPRIGASITYYGAAVLRQFEMMGAYPLNESVAITRARDKLRSLQLLARAGLGLPKTSFADSTRDTAALIELVGGAPLVVKLLSGTQGKGVVLADDHNAAVSLIQAFRELDAAFIVQEFIAEAGGADIRCFVIGEQVVAAMLRQARAGEFRANLHQGGVAMGVDLSEAERATAVRAASEMGLNVAGVDIVRSRRGPLVLEVNASPGLRGIEAASGSDIAGQIIAFIERNARPHNTQTRGTG